MLLLPGNWNVGATRAKVSQASTRVEDWRRCDHRHPIITDPRAYCCGDGAARLAEAAIWSGSAGQVDLPVDTVGPVSLNSTQFNRSSTRFNAISLRLSFAGRSSHLDFEIILLMVGPRGTRPKEARPRRVRPPKRWPGPVSALRGLVTQTITLTVIAITYHSYYYFY